MALIAATPAVSWAALGASLTGAIAAIAALVTAISALLHVARQDLEHVPAPPVDKAVDKLPLVQGKTTALD